MHAHTHSRVCEVNVLWQPILIVTNMPFSSSKNAHTFARSLSTQSYGSYHRVNGIYIYIYIYIYIVRCTSHSPKTLSWEHDDASKRCENTLIAPIDFEAHVRTLTHTYTGTHTCKNRWVVQLTAPRTKAGITMMHNSAMARYKMVVLDGPFAASHRPNTSTSEVTWQESFWSCLPFLTEKFNRRGKCNCAVDHMVDHGAFKTKPQKKNWMRPR
jgi:hypothetical protein